MLKTNTNYIEASEIERFIAEQKDNIEWINKNIEKASNAETRGYWARRKGSEEVALNAFEEWAKTLTIYRQDEE